MGIEAKKFKNTVQLAGANSAAFSDEPLALERLALVESEWAPRTLSEIYKRGEHLTGRVVRIYADGVFDLFHHGHAEQLKQIKQLIPNSYLIAGVCSDKDTQHFKAGSTVMTTNERCEILSHCRYVDEIHRSPPFFPTEAFVNSLKIDLVSHDCIPYAIGADIEDCYSPFKKTDRFLETRRAPGISTTTLIQRIVGNFEIYKKRQLARLGTENFSNI